VHFLSERFSDEEFLLRAIYLTDRRPDYWKNGKLSSAALKDPKGLSVERSGNRTISESVDYIKSHLEGAIVSFSVKACCEVEAKLLYLPNKRNPFHSEIHGSEEEKVLSDEQALFLARQARLEYFPEFFYLAE